MQESTQTRPAPAGEQAVWRVNGARVSAWRAWDGEVVVYDDLSGDNLKLDAVMSEIFRRLQQGAATQRSEEHTSELPSIMRISYAVFCLKKKKHNNTIIIINKNKNNIKNNYYK